jgi:hypothetical protein
MNLRNAGWETIRVWVGSEPGVGGRQSGYRWEAIRVEGLMGGRQSGLRPRWEGIRANTCLGGKKTGCTVLWSCSEPGFLPLPRSDWLVLPIAGVVGHHSGPPSSVVRAGHTCLSELLLTDPPRMTIATTVAAAFIFAIRASTGVLILWMELRLERSRAEAAERTRRAHIETLHKRLMRALRRLCNSIDFQEEDKSPLTSRASRPSVSVRGKDVHATVTREIDDA